MSVPAERSQSEPPLTRSRLETFDTCTNEHGRFQFKGYCVFCSSKYLPKDKKHPNRKWRRVVQCRTADRPGEISFKDRILDLCSCRDDNWAHEVRTRVLGAFSDLHAADGEYHKDCYDAFVKM